MNASSRKKGISITLATRITILRILGIPVFVLLLLYYKTSLAAGMPAEGCRIAALALFILIAATDALDGYLARKRNEITRLGTILDPIADKALILASVIMLTKPSLTSLAPQFPVWFALLVISRESILILGAFLVNAIHAHIEIKPRLMGKASTVLLMLSIVMILSKCDQRAVNVAVVAAAACILFSGIQYLVDGVAQLEHGHDKHPGGNEEGAS